MQETEQDTREIRRMQRRDLLVVLPVAVPVLVAAWWSSRWIHAQYRLDMDLSRSLGMLGAGVLAMPFAFYMDRKRRQSGRLTPRIERLIAGRTDRYRARMRWIWFVALGPMLVIQLLTLAGGSHGTAAATRHESWQLTWLLLTFLSVAAPGLLWPSRAAMQDGLTQARTLLAIQRGFATLMLLGLAALVLEAYRPGTLATSLMAVLILGVLVPQLTLMFRERGSAAAEAGVARGD